MSSQLTQSGYKRKYVPTRATYRKKGMSWYPVPKKRSSLYRSLISPNKLYQFKRTCSWQPGYNSYYGFTSPSGGIVYGGALGFNWCLEGPKITGSASSTSVTMPSVGEFQALFDEYRIDAVHVKIFYTNNVSNTSAAIGTFQQIALPTGQFCTDFDDSVPPGSNTELLQRPETKTLQWNSNGPLQFTIKRPKAAYTVNTVTGIDSVAKAPGGWMNMASVDTNIYGWKIFLEQFGSSTSTLQDGYFMFYFTYDISCRGVK